MKDGKRFKTVVDLVRIEHDKHGRPLHIYRKRKMEVAERSKVCLKELK